MARRRVSRREFVKAGAAASLAAAVRPAKGMAPSGPGSSGAAPVTGANAPTAVAAFDFDAIVVGSGFGGGPVACRLAEAGYRVLVLERGRRWKVDRDWVGPDDYFWKQDDPLEHHGWLDFRTFGNMSTVTGAGVGGGSLHYANVSIDAPPDAFDEGWPEELNHAELAAYYAKVKAT